MTHHPMLDVISQALVAATTRRTGFTLATLATVTPAGRPRVRSLILRQFAADPERLFFATDARSAKVAEIRANPQVALAMYDDAQSVQLRAEGAAAIIEDETERQRAWQTLAPHSRAQYADTAVPGTALSAAAVSDDDATAFKRFAWVGIELAWFDWLDLAAGPPERWQLSRSDTTWTGQQVVP
ncbi:MAG TPA: pyridoxamine 5'-phosphate oxidase family protein [Enteractinococcus sp.]